MPTTCPKLSSFYIVGGRSRHILWTLVVTCVLVFILIHFLPLEKEGRMAATSAEYAGAVLLSGMLVWKDQHRSPFCDINVRTRVGWQLAAAAMAPLVFAVVPLNLAYKSSDVSLLGIQRGMIGAVVVSPESLPMIHRLGRRH